MREIYLPKMSSLPISWGMDERISVNGIITPPYRETFLSTTNRDRRGLTDPKDSFYELTSGKYKRIETVLELP